DKQSGSTFIAETSTVTFDGTGEHTLIGETTFYALKGLTAGATLQFTEATTFYVTRCIGFSDITLRSATDNATWYFTYNGSSQTVQYCRIKDSNADDGDPVYATDNCEDLGNNRNWVFNAAAITQTSGQWDDPSTWMGEEVPGPSESVSIASGHDITLDSSEIAASLTVEGTLTLDINSQSVVLTIADGGTLTNSGTIGASYTGGGNTATIIGEEGGSFTFSGSDLDFTSHDTIYLGRLEYEPTLNLASSENIVLADDCTFNNVTVQSGGSFTQGANNDLYIKGNTSFADNTFTKATGSGRVYFIGDLTLNSGNNNLGHVEIGSSPDTTTLTNDATYDSLTINAGDVFNTAGYEVTVTTDIYIYGKLDCTDTGELDGTIITLGGNWYAYSGSTVTVSNASVVFNHPSSTPMENEILSNGSTFYLVEFNQSGSTWTLTDIFYSSGSVTVTSGVIDTGSYAMHIGSSVYINGGSFKAHGSTITVQYHWHDSSRLFEIGTSSVSIQKTGSMYGDFYNLSVAYAGETIILSQATPLRVYNQVSFNGGHVDPASPKEINVYSAHSNPIVINNPNTTFDINVYVKIYANTTTVYVPAFDGYPDLMLHSDTADSTTFYIETGGLTAQTIYVYGESSNEISVLNLNGESITCSSLVIGNNTPLYGIVYSGSGSINASNMSIEGGGVLYGENAQINCSGSWGAYTGSVFYAENSTVTLTGGGTLRTEGTGSFNHLVIDCPDNTITIEDSLDIDGIITLSSGTLDTKSGENNSIAIGGDFIRETEAIFECRLATVTFDASGTHQLTGSTTFYGLKALTAGATLQFEAGTTFYVTNCMEFRD
ncbi:MAG: hypothetical protein GF384_01185, partial [Elusimicrobia bacterium]|nr:hypothetical protein [Elusimicrobiota bacterium]